MRVKGGRGSGYLCPVDVRMRERRLGMEMRELRE